MRIILVAVKHGFSIDIQKIDTTTLYRNGFDFHVGAKTYEIQTNDAEYICNLFDMMSKAFSEQQNTQIKRRPRKVDASIADEIKKYKDLLDSGDITKEEYDDLKGRLLNGD